MPKPPPEVSETEVLPSVPTFGPRILRGSLGTRSRGTGQLFPAAELLCPGTCTQHPHSQQNPGRLACSPPMQTPAWDQKGGLGAALDITDVPFGGRWRPETAEDPGPAASGTEKW